MRQRNRFIAQVIPDHCVVEVESIMDVIIQETQADVPMELLLLADPSEELIREYLPNATVLVANHESDIVGAVVMVGTRPRTMEIMNISVYERYQNQGIGKQLLLKAIEQARNSKVKTLEIGTGNPGVVQMLLYQKCGFRIVGVELDYFRKLHNEPIMENGIECRDMIRMRLEL